MRTAEEILKEKTGHAHGLMDVMVIEAMKEYAKEVAKESLKNASENAEFVAEHQFYEETIKDSVDNVGSHLVFIDKQSILNESNIPEL